jgi:hypothetical protein
MARPSDGPAGTSPDSAKLVIAAANPLSGACSVGSAARLIGGSGGSGASGRPGVVRMSGADASAVDRATTTGSSPSAIGDTTPIGADRSGTTASDRWTGTWACGAKGPPRSGIDAGAGTGATTEADPGAVGSTPPLVTAGNSRLGSTGPSSAGPGSSQPTVGRSEEPLQATLRCTRRAVEVAGRAGTGRSEPFGWAYGCPGEAKPSTNPPVDGST